MCVCVVYLRPYHPCRPSISASPLAFSCLQRKKKKENLDAPPYPKLPPKPLEPTDATVATPPLPSTHRLSFVALYKPRFYFSQSSLISVRRFDAKMMLEKLRGRGVVFARDSIGRNQWESLLCMLSSVVPNKSSVYEVNGSPITKHSGSLIFRFSDYNCTVEYYRAPFLVLQSRAAASAPPNVKLTLKLDWSSPPIG